MRPLVITATGDLMFHEAVRDHMAATGDAMYSLRLVRDVLTAGDVLFGNFEMPISVARQPEPGCLPERYSPPGVARALKAFGFDVLNLANNHFYDFGPEGVTSTVEEMAGAGLPSVGVGRSEGEARQPVVVEIPQGRVGVLAYATAPMAVDPAHAWVACFPNVEKVRADVARLRSAVDVVMVSCHTGAQFNPYPAPETRTLARAAIDAGATLFVGHHPHVAQGLERIGDGLAVYSLGNFVAPYGREITRRTFFVRVTIDAGRVVNHEIVPCYIGEDCRTTLAEGALGEEIAADIGRLSAEIAAGRSDDLHFEVARSHMRSGYLASWAREFKRGGAGAILKKVRSFRPYHLQLLRRIVLGSVWRRIGRD